MSATTPTNWSSEHGWFSSCTSESTRTPKMLRFFLVAMLSPPRRMGGCDATERCRYVEHWPSPDAELRPRHVWQHAKSWIHWSWVLWQNFPQISTNSCDMLYVHGWHNFWIWQLKSLKRSMYWTEILNKPFMQDSSVNLKIVLLPRKGISCISFKLVEFVTRSDQDNRKSCVLYLSSIYSGTRFSCFVEQTNKRYSLKRSCNKSG